MITVYIISLGLLVCGGLLCYKGIKIYRIVQLMFCGAIGGYVGLMLVNAFGRQEFYILALALTVLGGFLGYKYYKFSLYLTVVLSTFVVTFSYFWKQAVSKASETISEIVKTKNAIEESMAGIKSLQDTLDSFDVMMSIRNNNWSAVIKESGDILKHGIVISVIVALVAGVLARLIGDYVIMTVSAAFGAMLITNLVEMFMEVSPMLHLLLLVVVGLSGIIVQYNTCKRRR